MGKNPDPSSTFQVYAYQQARRLMQSRIRVFVIALLMAHFFGRADGWALPILSGITQHGTQPGNNGATAGSPIWNTLGNEGSFANIYLTRPNGGYTAPLLNSGNGDGTSIGWELGEGTHEFFFFVMGFWDNNPGEYGLNLYFDGDNTSPGLAAFTPANTATAYAATGGIVTLALNGTATGLTPQPGDLSYVSEGLRVTLTSYGFGVPGQFGGPSIDRVGNLNSVADGYADSVGRFTLSVARVPDQGGNSFLEVAVLLILAGVTTRLRNFCR